MSQAPSWCSSYIGIPFTSFGRTKEGCDCWGLVKLVLAEQAHIHVPDFAISPHASLEVTEEFEEQRLSGGWRGIAPGFERPFDIAEMLTPTHTTEGWSFPPRHIGVVVSSGWLLHSEEATGAVLMKYREPHGINKRIAGFWRRL